MVESDVRDNFERRRLTFKFVSINTKKKPTLNI